MKIFFYPEVFSQLFWDASNDEKKKKNQIFHCQGVELSLKLIGNQTSDGNKDAILKTLIRNVIIKTPFRRSHYSKIPSTPERIHLIFSYRYLL